MLEMGRSTYLSSPSVFLKHGSRRKVSSRKNEPKKRRVGESDLPVRQDQVPI